nr:helix-turn-helix transcriptional regulator [Caulobacter sp. S45]
MDGHGDLSGNPSAETLAALLTARQLECLQLAAEGHASAEIGRRLGLSARTIDDHLAVACRRLGVRSRIQAVAIALTVGLIRPPVA